MTGRRNFRSRPAPTPSSWRPRRRGPSGPYALTWQGVSEALACGQGTLCQTLQGRIDALGDVDAYTFGAKAGDVVLVTIGRPPEAPPTCLRLFGPQGRLLARRCDGAVQLTASSQGTHTILVEPSALDATGSYGLSVTEILGPTACSLDIFCQQTVEDRIDPVGDVDAYRSSAAARGVLSLRIATPPDSASMCLRLLGPCGAPIGRHCGGSAQFRIAAGPHTLLVEPADVTSTGPYGITLQAVSARLTCGQRIVCDQTLEGGLDTPGEVDAYRFAAVAGDVVRLDVSSAAGPSSPCLRLFAPDGTQLTRDCEGVVPFDQLATGMHTVLVESSGPLAAGLYTITLGCVSCVDADADGRCDNADNCPNAHNPSQRDIDEDGRGDICDCARADGGAFAVPGEVTGLDLGCNGIGLTWDSAAPGAGSDAVHDVVRGLLRDLPVGGDGSEICLGSAVAGPMLEDPEVPAPGQGFWYLVRGRLVSSPGPRRVRCRPLGHRERWDSAAACGLPLTPAHWHHQPAGGHPSRQGSGSMPRPSASRL